MKQTTIDVLRFEGMSELSMEQLQSIEGGVDEGTSFWYDVFYTIGATAKGIVTFAKLLTSKFEEVNHRTGFNQARSFL